MRAINIQERRAKVTGECRIALIDPYDRNQPYFVSMQMRKRAFGIKEQLMAAVTDIAALSRKNDGVSEYDRGVSKKKIDVHTEACEASNFESRPFERHYAIPVSGSSLRVDLFVSSRLRVEYKCFGRITAI